MGRGCGKFRGLGPTMKMRSRERRIEERVVCLRRFALCKLLWMKKEEKCIRKDVWREDSGPTLTRIWAFHAGLSVVVFDFIARRYGEFGTLGLGELILTSTVGNFGITHVPLFERAKGKVLTEKDVEATVDRFEKRRIAGEDNGVEAGKDHADLRTRVPAVVAA